MRSISRRYFVQFGGAVALAWLAGCGSVSPWSSADKSRLGEVMIENRDRTPHEVTFRVEWAGKVVHDRSYTLAANDPTDEIVSAVSPEATWPTKPGDFRVMARLDEEAWQTATPAERDYPDCYTVVVHIDKTGDMAILTTTNATLVHRFQMTQPPAASNGELPLPGTPRPVLSGPAVQRSL